MDITRRQFMRLLPSGIVAVASTLSSLDNLVAEDQQDGPKVETVMDNGPSETRFDLLFMPEGYTNNDKKKFDADVEAIVKSFDKYSFFKEYGCLFNVKKQWMPSEAAWDVTGENKKTAFKITYDQKTKRAKSNADDVDFDKLCAKSSADIPCVLINTDKPVGTGGYVVMSPRDVLTVFHELGHAITKVKLVDEYQGVADYGFNVSNDEKNPHWKSLIGKVKGIDVYKIENGRYKAEKECLMATLTSGVDYGPLCTNGLIIALRGLVRPIEKATSADKTIDDVQGAVLPIEIIVSQSKSYTPQVGVFYQSGTADAMDALHDELKGKKLAFDSFGDKKYKKCTVSTKKNVATITDKLPVGSHLIAVVAKDPNPAILMDPDKVTYDQRIYRVDITEKK